MDREEVFKMLDNEGILVERLKDANSQRKLKKGRVKEHPKAEKGRLSDETGGGDKP
jgi:hypothetical protein